MDLQKLTIGQMAELNHISEQTLRLYDREGLLKPSYTDSSSGYRYYHILQSARLDFIQSMKVYGLTLREIGRMLRSRDAGAMRRALEEQSEKMNRKIDQLRHSKAAVERTLENYKKYEALPQNGEIFLEYIPERRIFTHSCGMNFFEQDESGYEYMLRQLKKEFAQNDIPLSYFSNIGTLIRRDRLLSGSMYSDEVFFFLEDEDRMPASELLPAASYVCVCSEKFSEEAENVHRLLDYINSRSCRIIGDYLCEVVIDFPILDSVSRTMCYKTQIPVQFFGKNTLVNNP